MESELKKEHNGYSITEKIEKLRLGTFLNYTGKGEDAKLSCTIEFDSMKIYAI